VQPYRAEILRTPTLSPFFFGDATYIAANTPENYAFSISQGDSLLPAMRATPYARILTQRFGKDSLISVATL